MDELELLQRIEQGENATTEFKVECPHRDKLAQTLSAFANSHGGILIIGVGDDKEIVGLTHDELEESADRVVEICQDLVKPPIHIKTIHKKMNGKFLLLVEVERQSMHEVRGIYYERQGNRKVRISPERLRRLTESRAREAWMPYDEQPVPETGRSCLDKRLYQRFTRAETDPEEEQLLLCKRRLLVKDSRGRLRASVAGMLMCSQMAHEHHPLINSYVDAVCYRGTRRDANDQIDAKKFTGPLDQQIVDSFNFVRKHNIVSAKKTLGREDHPQYSIRAVFEGLVNAVTHRDYSIYGSKIRLFIYADRLEIISPGELPNSLTTDDLPYHQFTRNPLLAKLLSELTFESPQMSNDVSRRKFIEERGEGVPIILQESEQLSGRTPEYMMRGGQLYLTIHAAGTSTP